VLHVKTTAFGKETSGLRLRKVVLPPSLRQEERSRDLPCAWRGGHVVPLDQQGCAAGGTTLSYKAVLQGGRREIARKTDCGLP
ncbi:hypothetical protein Dimus_030900, partial [Dionaea muscipula]